MEKFHVIRHLKMTEGLSARAIAKKLSLNKKTVNRYLKMDEPPQYKKREKSTRVDPSDQFSQRVEDLCKDPKNLAVDIYELLLNEGYKGSARTISRRVKELRDQKNKERFYDQKYTPGDQSQFDFKESIKIPFVDGERSLNLLFGTMPYSGAFFISAFHLKTYECFIEGMYRFFDKIGGQTQEQRIDNLSPCVAKVHKGKRRTYTNAFQGAINHYNLNISPCRPGKGNDKGDVEREIRTQARRIERKITHESKCFKNIEEFNLWLDNYCEQRWSEKTQEKLKEEQPKLLPLLKRDERVMCRVESLKIGPTGLVKAGDYVYSVPAFAISKRCELFRTPEKIIIKVDGELIATHCRLSGSSILLEHIIHSLVLKPGAMIRWAHKEVLFPTDRFKGLYLSLKKEDKDSAEREYLRILNLIQHKSIEEIEAVIKTGLTNYFQIKKELLGENVQVLDDQPGFTPDLDVYDQLINKGEE